MTLLNTKETNYSYFNYYHFMIIHHHNEEFFSQLNSRTHCKGNICVKSCVEHDEIYAANYCVIDPILQ